MATNRTINFYGYAYGDVPVQLNAHINGELVFSGAVSTLNEAMPDTNGFDMSTAPILFSVTESALFPIDFAGTYPLTLSVATGDGILQCNTFSNYMEQITKIDDKWVTTPGTVDVFSDCFTEQTDSDDSRTKVTIDGMPMPEDRTDTGVGQWTIEIMAGSTMSCDFSVSLGNVVAQ